MERQSNNPSDPWSFNPLDTFDQKPHGRLPEYLKPRRAPSPIPDLQELFDVQRDTLKVVKMLEHVEHELLKAGIEINYYRELQRQARNAYKVTNRWLKNYGTR